jgi:transcriptional regulator with XRE-family HTH domain
MRKSVHTSEYGALLKELRQLRKSAALTQRDLARRLNVHHSLIAKVESGERRIDVIEFCWIVIACDGDPPEVFGRVDHAVSKGRPEGRRS